MGMTDYGQFILLGSPKQGQSLEEVRKLMLAEIEKLKKGQFSDNLLPAVVNNMKLSYYRSLQSNRSRADKFVDAFINGQKWSDQVNRLDRISKMTRQRDCRLRQPFLPRQLCDCLQASGQRYDNPQD